MGSLETEELGSTCKGLSMHFELKERKKKRMDVKKLFIPGSNIKLAYVRDH